MDREQGRQTVSAPLQHQAEDTGNRDKEEVVTSQSCHEPSELETGGGASSTTSEPQLLGTLQESSFSSTLAHSAIDPSRRPQERLDGISESIADARHRISDLSASSKPLLQQCIKAGLKDLTCRILNLNLGLRHCVFDDGTTPLRTCCLCDDLDLFSCLCEEYGFDVDEYDVTNGWSLLHLACAARSKKVARYLLEQHPHQARLMVGARRVPPSFLAAQLGDADVVASFVELQPSATRLCRADGASPLLVAVQEGHMQCVRLLLQVADPDAQTLHGTAAIHIAALRNDVELCRLLIDAGKADLNLQREDGAAALHIASAKGYEQTVSMLLARGANPLLEDHSSLSPFDVAIQDRRPAVVRLFLQHDSSLAWRAVRSLSGRPAYSRSQRPRNSFSCDDSSQESTSPEPSHLRPVTRVQDEPIAVITPMLQAAEVGSHDVIEILWRTAGEACFASGPVCTQRSPLLAACQSGSAGAAQFLVNISPLCDINRVCSRGLSPLFWACHHGLDDIVQALLARGASWPPEVALDGNPLFTPVHAACSAGSASIVSALCQHFPSEVATLHCGDGKSSPLFVACLTGHTQAASVLLDFLPSRLPAAAWALVLEQSLFAAVRLNHTDLVRLLVSSGTSILMRSAQGLTCLDLAIAGENLDTLDCVLEQIAALPESERATQSFTLPNDHLNPSLIALYFKHGFYTWDLAGAIGGDDRQPSLLVRATRVGSEDCVRWLLEHRPADCNLVHHIDCTGKAALHWASPSRHSGIVRLLLDHGADVNAVDRDGWTPLQLACLGNSLDGVIELLQHPTIDVDVVRHGHNRNNNLPALFLACALGHEDCAKVIAAFGASIVSPSGVAAGNLCPSLRPLFQQMEGKPAIQRLLLIGDVGYRIARCLIRNGNCPGLTSPETLRLAAASSSRTAQCVLSSIQSWKRLAQPETARPRSCTKWLLKLFVLRRRLSQQVDDNSNACHLPFELWLMTAQAGHGQILSLVSDGVDEDEIVSSSVVPSHSTAH